MRQEREDPEASTELSICQSAAALEVEVELFRKRREEGGRLLAVTMETGRQASEQRGDPLEQWFPTFLML